MNTMHIIDNWLPDDTIKQFYDISQAAEYTVFNGGTDLLYNIDYYQSETISSYFSSDEFITFASNLTGVEVNELHEAFISRMQGNYLVDWHNDKTSAGEKLTFLLFMNPDWDLKDGGELEMATGEIILPKFNRLVMFSCRACDHIEHRVKTVSTDKIRYGITGRLK